MGIKLLIAAACVIVAADGVASHADIGDIVEVDSKDEAHTLCRIGRAFYTDKANDPTKGALTAGDDDKARIKALAAAIAKERKAAAGGAVPANLQALIDDAVAKALAAAKPAGAAA